MITIVPEYIERNLLNIAHGYFPLMTGNSASIEVDTFGIKKDIRNMTSSWPFTLKERGVALSVKEKGDTLDVLRRPKVELCPVFDKEKGIMAIDFSVCGIDGVVRKHGITRSNERKLLTTFSDVKKELNSLRYIDDGELRSLSPDDVEWWTGVPSKTAPYMFYIKNDSQLLRNTVSFPSLFGSKDLIEAFVSKGKLLKFNVVSEGRITTFTTPAIQSVLHSMNSTATWRNDIAAQCVDLWGNGGGDDYWGDCKLKTSQALRSVLEHTLEKQFGHIPDKKEIISYINGLITRAQKIISEKADMIIEGTFHDWDRHSPYSSEKISLENKRLTLERATAGDVKNGDEYAGSIFFTFNDRNTRAIANLARRCGCDLLDDRLMFRLSLPVSKPKAKSVANPLCAISLLAVDMTTPDCDLAYFIE